MVMLSQQNQEQLDKARDLLTPAPTRDMGFMRSLFFGRVASERVLPYPQQDAEEAARTHALSDRVMAYLRDHVDADEIDRQERIPPQVIAGLAGTGVMGMTVPREYGGQGLGHTAYCRVLEHVTQHCASTAVLIAAHQSIGLKALLLMGNDEQKRRWLPDLASGRKLAAFCLSEPDVGSDAASVKTRATLSADGQHWLLNGEKRYATNAALASFMTVMAQTPVERDGKTVDRVTAFIVTPDLPGFAVTHANRSKCGIRGSWQASLRFTDMPVPRQNVLGELGEGLKVALSVLDYGRCTLSAGCVGGARKALALAIHRARTRKQFGRPIGAFQLIKQKIARMAELTYAMEAVTYLTTGMVDRHDPDVMLETAASKTFCAEALWTITDDAMQIWGGEGYMREHGIERMLRDARINRIVEGTTEIMTSFIALVGMKAVGDQLEQTVRAVRHPFDGFGRLSSFARHEWNDLVIGHELDITHPRLLEMGRTIGRLARTLGRRVERLLATHRQGIIELQLIQQRVAWSAIELFVMACVISRMQSLLGDAAIQSPDGLDRRGQRDLLVGEAFCHHAAARITRRLDQLAHPDDDLTLAVADAVLHLRDDSR